MRLERFNEFKDGFTSNDNLSDRIDRMKFISKEMKDYCKPYISYYTKIKKAKIYSLELSSELLDRIKELNAPRGFSMGIDKDGIFIHTHRGRSKSKDNINLFTLEDFKRTDSTG